MSEKKKGKKHSEESKEKAKRLEKERKKEREKVQKKETKERDREREKKRRSIMKLDEELQKRRKKPLALREEKKRKWNDLVDSISIKVTKELKIKKAKPIDILTKNGKLREDNKLWLEVITKIGKEITIEMAKRDMQPFKAFADNVAEEISEFFKYNEIIHMEKSVYGYLETYYPYDWEDLLSEGIFDRASLYAIMNYKPEIIHVIKIEDLDDYEHSMVMFKEEIALKNYPKRPFQRAIIYTPKSFSSSIKFIKNVPIFVDGYKIKANLGKGNYVILNWPLVDLPVVLLTFSPGQHKAVFDIKIKPEKVIEDTITILKKMVYYYREESLTWEDNVRTAKIQTEKYRKRNRELEDIIETDKPDEPPPSTEEPKIIYSNNPILYILISLLAVISIIGFFI